LESKYHDFWFRNPRSFFVNLMIVLLFSIRFPQNLVNFLTLDAKPFGKMISEYTNLLLLFADIRGKKLERWTDCVYGYKNGSCGFSGRMRLTSKLLHYLILYWYRALIFFESRNISDLWRRRQKLIPWYFGMLSIDILFFFKILLKFVWLSAGWLFSPPIKLTATI
jgi:hypothetical protein